MMALEFFKSNLYSRPDAQSRTSLTADWKKYSASADVETGQAIGSQDAAAKLVDSAGANITNFFQSSYTTVSSGLGSVTSIHASSFA
jgi:hypothetical protein